MQPRPIAETVNPCFPNWRFSIFLSFHPSIVFCPMIRSATFLNFSEDFFSELQAEWFSKRVYDPYLFLLGIIHFPFLSSISILYRSLTPLSICWIRLFHPQVEGKLIREFEGLDVGDRVRIELGRMQDEDSPALAEQEEGRGLRLVHSDGEW